MKNTDVRIAAHSAGVKLWEVGEAIGLCDSGFSRKLRKELPAEEKQRIFETIEMIKKEKERENND